MTSDVCNNRVYWNSSDMTILCNRKLNIYVDWCVKRYWWRNNEVTNKIISPNRIIFRLSVDWIVERARDRGRDFITLSFFFIFTKTMAIQSDAYLFRFYISLSFLFIFFFIFFLFYFSVCIGVWRAASWLLFERTQMYPYKVV